LAKTVKTYAAIVMFTALLIALTSSVDVVAQTETATETTITEAQTATENATVTTITVTVTMTETTTQYLYIPSVSTIVVTVNLGIPINSFIWASGLLLILGLAVGYILGVRSEGRRVAAQLLPRPQKPEKPAKR